MHIGALSCGARLITCNVIQCKVNVWLCLNHNLTTISKSNGSIIIRKSDKCDKNKMLNALYYEFVLMRFFIKILYYYTHFFLPFVNFYQLFFLSTLRIIFNIPIFTSGMGSIAHTFFYWKVTNLLDNEDECDDLACSPI